MCTLQTKERLSSHHVSFAKLPTPVFKKLDDLVTAAEKQKAPYVAAARAKSSSSSTSKETNHSISVHYFNGFNTINSVGKQLEILDKTLESVKVSHLFAPSKHKLRKPSKKPQKI